MKLGCKGWIIPSAVPELGVTFSWSRHSFSACVYLVKVNLIGTFFWNRTKAGFK